MARLHRQCLVAPAAASLLLLLLAALACAAAAADPPVKKKAGMRMRTASREEARWLDRYAETHHPLGAGPLTMRPATPEEAQWLNRMSGTTERARASSHDGAGDGDDNYIEFDDDSPYVQALRDWVSRLTKQRMEEAKVENNPFKDL